MSYKKIGLTLVFYLVLNQITKAQVVTCVHCDMKRLVLLLCITLIFQSCAPSLSQYQTAATLVEGNKSNIFILEHTFDTESGPGRDGSVDVSVG